MADVSRIFPGHICLAASSHCWQSSSLLEVLKFGNLLGYFLCALCPLLGCAKGQATSSDTFKPLINQLTSVLGLARM